MQIEQVFEMSRSDTIEAKQYAKLFQALHSTANTGSMSACECECRHNIISGVNEEEFTTRRPHRLSWDG